jgi:hypothetical protein
MFTTETWSCTILTSQLPVFPDKHTVESRQTKEGEGIFCIGRGGGGKGEGDIGPRKNDFKLSESWRKAEVS